MTTDERIDRLASMMEARFDAVDARFKAVDARFGRLEDYILQFRGEVIRRLDGLEQRLDFVAAAVPPLNKAVLDFGSMASQVMREQSRIMDVHSDFAARLARLEEQVSKLIKPAA